jgi:hypothetical protein
VRHRGGFAYVTGELADGASCRCAAYGREVALPLKRTVTQSSSDSARVNSTRSVSSSSSSKEFDRRYREELNDAERAPALEHLREVARSGTLTLLTATRHAEISQAAVLADLIRG